MPSTATVCVIIAAKDAAPTIGRAVGSALREEPVAEVVVVDDGSADRTTEAALAADDGSGRAFDPAARRQSRAVLRPQPCDRAFERPADRHPRRRRLLPRRPVRQAA